VNELLQRLMSTYDNLSPRERILVAVSGGAVVLVFLVMVVIQPIVAAVGDQSAVDNAAQRVVLITRLQSDFDEVNSRLSLMEQRIKNNRDTGNLRSLLSSLAQTANVEVESMEERPAGNSDVYQETKVDVALRRVNLEQAITYLHSIESNERMLSIKSLRMKNRADKTKLLDVSFSVSSFTPI
jgi:type II secretory pathway component PulM